MIENCVLVVTRRRVQALLSIYYQSLSATMETLRYESVCLCAGGLTDVPVFCNRRRMYRNHREHWNHNFFPQVSETYLHLVSWSWFDYQASGIYICQEGEHVRARENWFINEEFYQKHTNLVVSLAADCSFALLPFVFTKSYILRILLYAFICNTGGLFLNAITDTVVKTCIDMPIFLYRSSYRGGDFNAPWCTNWLFLVAGGGNRSIRRTGCDCRHWKMKRCSSLSIVTLGIFRDCNVLWHWTGSRLPRPLWVAKGIPFQLLEWSFPVHVHTIIFSFHCSTVPFYNKPYY